jgi:transcriptional regulator with XRE-family HTH domain
MISQIEREQANPTLAVTLRIAQAFGMPLAELVDAPGATATVQVIRQHYQKQKASILFNQVQKQTVLGRELDPLAARIGLPALVHTVARRQAYQHALLLGWKALDGGAREEILQVALEIVTF